MGTKSKKRWLKAIGTLILVIVAFSAWYKITYSMEVIKEYEINSPDLPKKVLIATQGSIYKDSLTSNIINYLQPQQVYIKVIDVSGLKEINTTDWNAIIIMHTWEVNPQKDAALFLEKEYNPDKMLVVSTSGDGGNRIEGVDAITGASEIKDIEYHTRQLCTSLENILQ